MIKVAKKYCNLALCCDAILLSTMLHPAWRLSLIEDKYPNMSIFPINFCEKHSGRNSNFNLALDRQWLFKI
jgi:hypothetical protein